MYYNVTQSIFNKISHYFIYYFNNAFVLFLL